MYLCCTDPLVYFLWIKKLFTGLTTFISVDSCWPVALTHVTLPTLKHYILALCFCFSVIGENKRSYIVRLCG